MSGMPTRSVCKGRCESRPRLKDWVSTGMGGGGKSISHIQRTPPRPPLHRPHTIKTPSYVWPLLPLPSPCFYHLRRPKLTSMTFSILAPSSPPFKQIPSPHLPHAPAGCISAPKSQLIGATLYAHPCTPERRFYLPQLLPVRPQFGRHAPPGH